MGFLDNSGDIILDAVLTDTGRMRLARGDGSFNVAKFALGDEEINYGLYNSSHSSGSAYYDVEILQTPVLEAFTNNTSTMKSKLITISRTNILYLPIIKLNESNGGVKASKHSEGVHLIGVDSNTVDNSTSGLNFNGSVDGLINGYIPSDNANIICFDQGIDNSEAIKTVAIDPDLKETQYIVQLDHRLASVASPMFGEGTVANYSFLDDDSIATYYLTLGSTGNNSNYVEGLSAASSEQDTNSVLAGKRGTRLKLALKASESLTNSVFLFNKLGVDNYTLGGKTFYKIDTTIRIMGATTGYSLELPIRFIKYKSG